MEYLMFVCPLPMKSAGLYDYISNSVAQFHFLQYFSLAHSKPLAGSFNRGTTMVIGRSFLFAGRAPPPPETLCSPRALLQMHLSKQFSP